MKEKGMGHIVNGLSSASFRNAQPWTEKTAITPETKNFPAFTFITFYKDTAFL